MSDLDTEKAKKANQNSVEALERIQKEGLLPLPEIYYLWYVYYAASNMDILRTIDLFVANSQPITQEACLELYQRFLSNQSEDNTVREAGDKIQETIKDMSGLFENARSRTEKYGKSLLGLTKNLDENANPDEVRSVLNGVISNTQEMLKQNKQLEIDLVKSSEAMADLKRDLATVRKEALTDGLTQLANRKAFDIEIERAVLASVEEEKAFSLVFLDIDHFKPFNDQYGHQVGDQVLRLVARTLVDGVKGRDITARYGGEEFVIILPGTNLGGGHKVAESLLQSIAAKEVVNRNTGVKLGKITLSAGVAEYVSGESADDIIRRADKALYSAKNNGRNQVSLASASPDK